MSTMAGRTRLYAQALVKGYDLAHLVDSRTFCRAKSDISHLVARDTLIRLHTLESHVASKTIRLKRRMGRYERAGCDHELRIDKNQNGKANKVDCNAQQEPAAHYFHPQNRKILAIWPSARTVKASVIGK